jgi:DNA repair ATPase RecN
LLVDLHQQFDTLELGSENFQRDVMDALAGNSSLLQNEKKVCSLYRIKKEPGPGQTGSG